MHAFCETDQAAQLPDHWQRQVRRGIAATEVITKFALFYGHERVWAAVRWGPPKATPEIEHRPQMRVSLDRRHCPVCTPAT